MAAVTAPLIFVRTRFTWLAYLALAYFAYLQAVLGPLMPYLSDELRLNYTEAGYHFSAFAAGMMISGAVGDQVMRRMGRRFAFWGGGAGMAIAALVLIGVQTIVLTVLSTFCMGLLGTLTLVSIQAGLADAHGKFRAAALTEANIAASASAVLAPLLVGELQRLGIGWRGAVVAAVATFLVMALWYWRVTIPQPDFRAVKSGPQSTSRIPRLFWLYWLVMFLTVAVEWCIAYWGAGYLETAVGLPRTTAATVMAFYFGASVIGRISGSRLVRRYAPEKVALLALGFALVGFPLFWLGTVPLVNVVGLAIAGLGIANLFPLILTLALGVSPENANTLSARTSLASGSAILIAPQMLGVLADRIGIQNAYAIGGIFLIAASITVVIASRQRTPSEAAQT
jgi:fucose permease